MKNNYLIDSLEEEYKKYNEYLSKFHYNNNKNIYIYLSIRKTPNSKIKIIKIKYSNIFHLLGIQYFKKFLKIKNEKDIDSVINSLLKYKNNYELLEKHFNFYNSQNKNEKIKIKLIILLYRIISYFKIINFFFNCKKGEEMIFYKSNIGNINNDNFISFNFFNYSKIILALKDINIDKAEYYKYVPISILINPKLNKNNKEFIYFNGIKIY